ncbi:MAG TPA: hypothetical protein VEP90_09620 [Methylomirabilota bacterium]|nr:hypothetical protein [Methylomirabilota bacterium]
MAKPKDCWEFEGYPRSIAVESANEGHIEITISRTNTTWGDELDICIPKDKAVEMAKHILSIYQPPIEDWWDDLDW